MSCVAAVLAHMALRGPGSSPFFKIKDGQPLTHQLFVTKLHEVPQAVQSKY